MRFLMVSAIFAPYTRRNSRSELKVLSSRRVLKVISTLAPGFALLFGQYSRWGNNSTTPLAVSDSIRFQVWYQ